MSITAILITSMLVFVTIAIIHFRKKNKAAQLVHQSSVSHIKKSIRTHQMQILYRHEGLQRYDFLRHNLKEALLVQAEIVL